MAVCCWTRATQLSEARKIEFFEKRIRPVLVEHCYRCHSTASKKDRGGLLLDTRDAIRKGGDSGPAFEPGNPKGSLLLEAMGYKNEDLQMPPKAKLPDAVINDFRRWIAMGAPDPRGGKVAVAKKYGPAKDLWCLQPLAKGTMPMVKDKTWAKSEMDRFVLAKLEAVNLRPGGDARPMALLRRLHYDLVGLPPTPEVIERFQKAVAQDQQAAIVAEVDRLLASPQFGERWGRHWLDVARYGESNGRDRDVLFPNAWRYRNYVIDAFHQDKPYNRFIQEQIAGDLLPAADQQERDQLRIATGFLTLGPKSFMKRGKDFDMDLIDEQIDVTTRAFLGLTVSCARCHDHKFDPIPTKDYYSIASIFASTKTLFGPRSNAKKATNLQPIGKVAKGKPKQNKGQQQQLVKLRKQVRASTNRLKKLQAGEKIKTKAGTFITIATERKRLQRFQAQLKQLQQNAPPGQEFCMAVTEGNIQDLRVMIRGDYKKLGKPAPRGVLTTVKLDTPIKINPKQSGRLDLAKWIADPSNPLTARVAVNRIWHHLFGQGLVRTVDNFGTNGEQPSHPELLDYLATKFMQDGWSFKKAIRHIALSRTYQLDTAYNDANYEIDPANRLLWRRSLRRLDVEALRDSILAASGKLELKRPAKSLVARIGYGEVGRGINTKPLEEPFPHRTVYMAILRTAMPDVLKVWDFAEPSLVVGNRPKTNVPNQALYLMNNPFVIAHAKAMAERVLQAETKADERVRLAYQLALARTPENTESERALAFLQRMQDNLRKRYPNETERRRIAWTSFCQALFASAEFRYLN